MMRRIVSRSVTPLLLIGAAGACGDGNGPELPPRMVEAATRLDSIGVLPFDNIAAFTVPGASPGYDALVLGQIRATGSIDSLEVAGLGGFGDHRAVFVDADVLFLNGPDSIRLRHLELVTWTSASPEGVPDRAVWVSANVLPADSNPFRPWPAGGGAFDQTTRSTYFGQVATLRLRSLSDPDNQLGCETERAVRGCTVSYGFAMGSVNMEATLSAGDGLGTVRLPITEFDVPAVRVTLVDSLRDEQ